MEEFSGAEDRQVGKTRRCAGRPSWITQTAPWGTCREEPAAVVQGARGSWCWSTWVPRAGACRGAEAGRPRGGKAERAVARGRAPPCCTRAGS